MDLSQSNRSLFSAEYQKEQQETAKETGNKRYHLYDFYDESTFHRKLYLEIKAAERSGKSFLLMLIDIEGLLQQDETLGMVPSEVVYALLSSIRDTDIKGWYRYGSVVGVVFCGIEELNETTKSMLLARMRENVAPSFSPEQLSLVDISLVVLSGEQGMGMLQ